MSINPPSPDGSTGMTIFTFGSALPEMSLTAPVVRSATNAVLLSGPMMSPLVLSRQPCMTPGAGQAFGKGVGGSGGGGGGVELGWGFSSGLVVKGWDWASLNRAHPLATSITAERAASPHRTERPDRPSRMTDRLRTRPAPPPHACPCPPPPEASPVESAGSPISGFPGGRHGGFGANPGRFGGLTGESAAQIPDSGPYCPYPDTRDQSIE